MWCLYRKCRVRPFALSVQHHGNPLGRAFILTRMVMVGFRSITLVSLIYPGRLGRHFDTFSIIEEEKDSQTTVPPVPEEAAPWTIG
jgi:hypothetical protein